MGTCFEFAKRRTDAEILAEVRKLLAAETQNNFAEPVANLSQLWRDDKAEDFIGKQIGSYKITKEIGRGGMGIVFEAVRSGEDFSQTVALKLLKRGMDSDVMLRRFRHERQILASLEHPNIARLLDGGISADGTPFFAMEFVEGKPLDEFCNEKNLTINERLRLFLQVCAAVSFAHSRLVVHRDLKPTNILVTNDGSVKLLDFGIAKILSPENDLQNQTVTALGMMTPAYASPEQIKGETLTTASRYLFARHYSVRTFNRRKGLQFFKQSPRRNGENHLRSRTCSPFVGFKFKISGSKFKVENRFV